ncbi:MAG: type II toxin-antitoxin system VapC family toxin [Spirochaetia bacterium]
MYFLDTNICIYYLNGKYEKVKEHILSTPPNSILIPAIVKAELLLGAYKSQRKDANLKKVHIFLAPFKIIPFSDEMTFSYAEVRYQAESTGQFIGPNDMIIAATVQYYQETLVTNNEKEFRSVEGLKIENWAVG